MRKLPGTTAALAIAGAMAATSASAATIAHQTDFSGDAGFTFEHDWYIGGAQPADSPQFPQVGNPDPVLDHTPTDDNQRLSAGRLNGLTLYDSQRGQVDNLATSPVIDLAGYTDVTFSFWRFLNTDYLPFMSNTVEVFDGSDWVVLETGYAFGSQPTDSEWVLRSYDVSAYANANFQYRFGYTVGAPAFSVSGWNVDDVLIAGTAPLAATVPERATWALMIGGFGAAGAMLRRRRGAVA